MPVDIDAAERFMLASARLLDFGVWSPGQLAECRGIVSLDAIAALDVHGRVEAPRGR